MQIKNIILLSLILLSFGLKAKEHPCLILTKESVPELQEALSVYPLWKQDVSALINEVDAAMQNPIDVPLPVDPAGGYTHGQHKQNAILLNKLATAYQVMGDEKYAAHAKKIFLAYAKIYPTLGEHPVKKSYAPGKLFWQQLNEAVWLVDAIQGYDGIYDYLTDKERKTIEEQLLLPFADFLSVGNAKVFNRIHNHGVWAVAAVGMTGIALNNNELICRALYGINDKGKPKYNNIDKAKLEDFGSGFFVQTSSLFSPDGYYTEGPYYQRYAMTPFLLFAQSIHNNIPQLKALEFGNQIFIKAVETLLELTDAKGDFLPINDNLKGMNLNAPSVVWAINFLYANTLNPELLSIAHNNSFRLINSLGLVVVKGLSSNLQEPVKQESKLITDGKNGDAGGIVLLHDSSNEFCTVFKFASQGLTHGHYDRLNLFYYHKGTEILSDYGSARYVNVKAKEGGRYLPENKTYAKQTIAHNTLVVNEKSHFNFNYKEAAKYNPELIFSEISNAEFQLVCARDTNAYKGIKMTRVIGVLSDPAFSKPIVIDVFNIESDKIETTYDLPFHYKGQLLSADFEYAAYTNAQKPLGIDNGYQHIWLTALGKTKSKSTGITWLENNSIYSLTTVVDEKSELIFGQTGANDPNFNLRNEPLFMIRQNGAKNHTFASILECHGKQNPETEIVTNQNKNVFDVKVLNVPKPYLALSVKTIDKKEFLLLVYTEKSKAKTSHSLEIEGKSYVWSSQYKLYKN